jgi:polygalacturonase
MPCLLTAAMLSVLTAVPLTMAGGGQTFDVTSFGAKGDGHTDDTRAVRAAAAAVASAGGGTLLFPAPIRSATDCPPGARPLPQPCPSQPGHTFCPSDPTSHQCDAPSKPTCPACPKPSGAAFSTAPFNISSNMHVEIEAGVTLVGSTTVDWPLISVASVWPGYGYDGDPNYLITHQALLFSWQTRNISVGGGGTINCGGARWSNCQMNVSKSPCYGHTRPRCVVFSNATDVTFEDITLLNSPSWTLDFTSIDHLRVRRVNVTQPGGGNRDGIDLDSCRDVIVEDSFVASGDDTLVVKSGKDFFGRRYNRPSRDIIWRNITTGGGCAYMFVTLLLQP